MYSIADALAVRLAPGVRERQSRPRFLSAMAVSLAVCSAFDDEIVASDGVSQPWQVFEWYVVEGLVRVLGTSGRLSRVPGIDKVRTAIRDRVPISASRYLKTPRVFGFHGVYRTLARELHIETLDRLGEAGYEILSVWAEEQGVQGFFDSTKGPGDPWRESLVDAVKDGLAKGHTSRSGGWQGWQFLAEHLAPDVIGKKEGKALAQALLRDSEGFRGPVIEYLISSDGQAILAGSASDSLISERAFHAGLRKATRDSLGYLLDTISAYERFCRFLQDAFDDSLYEMSQSKRRLSPRELGQCQSVASASQEIPEQYPRLEEMLVPFGLGLRFQETFVDVAERQPAEVWAASLLEHHRRIQRQKLPNGKAPWIERFDDGTYLVRTAYLRDEPGLHKDEYVHYYRTQPLLSFARDLGMVK
ncbi:MAG: hypothetical protein U9Q79_10565 [Candidatus Hydrogenedentes bacterium]|nr:hypothetical protein [Candidatus Hydrogenedentota bacterium]